MYVYNIILNMKIEGKVDENMNFTLIIFKYDNSNIILILTSIKV